MRMMLFIVIGVLIHSYSFSQTDTTIELIPNWKKGDIKKYEIKNYSTVKAESETKTNGLTTKTIVIQIVDVKEKTLELTWEVDQLTVSDTINSDNPFSGLMKSLDKDVSVKYTINRNGNNIRILNLDEIKKTIKARIDTTLKEFIRKNEIEKSKAEMLNLQFSMMFSTDEQIKAIALSDILKFHQIYGYLFMADRTTIIPDNIFAPNENGRPSNKLELKYSKFDSKNKIHFIHGELKSDESNERMREFINKDRIIKNTYEFKSPENWLIAHKSTMNAAGGDVKVSTTYEINLMD